MIPRVHKTEKEDRIMIHKNISIRAEGSLKDSHLTTYILDSYDIPIPLPSKQFGPSVV